MRYISTTHVLIAIGLLVLGSVWFVYWRAERAREKAANDAETQRYFDRRHQELLERQRRERDWKQQDQLDELLRR